MVFIPKVVSQRNCSLLPGLECGCRMGYTDAMHEMLKDFGLDESALAKARHVALVSTGGLGDVILFSPVFKAVRKVCPVARIRLHAASSLVREAYLEHPALDGIDLADTNRRISIGLYLQLLRQAHMQRLAGGVDLMVFASRLSSRLTGLFKFVFRPRQRLSCSHPADTASDLEVNLEIARALDGDITAADVFVPVSSAAKADIEARLASAFGARPALPLVAVYPSRELPNRPCWNTDLLRDTAVALAAEIGGRIVVLGDAHIGERWRTECGAIGDWLNWAGSLRIQETAALLARSRIALCNDGGVMHLAGAVGCPVVGFMPNVSRMHWPPGRRVRVLNGSGLPCFSCYPKRPFWCRRRATAPCVERITVAAALAAAREILHEE